MPVIETSEEISPVEDLVNPWRLQHGDLEVARNMRGMISRAIPSRLTLIQELVRRDILPRHFERYGVGFLELRAAFRAPWAIRRMQGTIEILGGGISGSQADAMYENICKKIEMWRTGVIEFVIESGKEHEHLGHHGMYNDCFARLVVAMDEERERVYEENKNR